MRDSLYDDIFSECFDLHDSDTLMNLSYLTEEQKDATILILANRLYKMITNKIADIDYGTIPKSQGDITRFTHFERMRDSITTIRDIARKSGEGIEEATEIETAFDNLIKHRDLFVKGYKLDIDIIKVFYENMVLAIIVDITYFTSVCVEFIKNPKSTVRMEINNLKEYRSKFGFIHEVLIKFNKSCDKGEFEKTFGGLIAGKSRKFISGIGALTLIGSAGSILTLIGIAYTLIKLFIPMLRELVYFFFATRVKLQDYFNLQADLIEANADMLDKDKSDKEVITAQRRWAERFRRYANFFALDYVPAKNKAEKEIQKDTKKVTMNTDGDVEEPSAEEDPSDVLF